MDNNLNLTCNRCKYYEGVHNVQGHAPCSYWNKGAVLWNDSCSYFYDIDEPDINEQNTNISIKENELYQEIELFCGETKIGEAEIDLKNDMLAKLIIYKPYQNQGYGTEIVKMLTEKYDLNNLWVRADNKRAIHVYEKCGFEISKPTMYEMRKIYE